MIPTEKNKRDIMAVGASAPPAMMFDIKQTTIPPVEPGGNEKRDLCRRVSSPAQILLGSRSEDLTGKLQLLPGGKAFVKRLDVFIFDIVPLRGLVYARDAVQISRDQFPAEEEG